MPKRTSKFVHQNQALAGLSGADSSDVVALSVPVKRQYLTFGALVGLGALVFGAGYLYEKSKPAKFK